MKILILSASDPYKTAGIVALDIYNGLKNNKENQVKLLVKNWRKFQDHNISSIENRFTDLRNKVVRKCMKFLVRINLIKPNYPKTNPDYHVQDFDQTIVYYSTKKILKKAGFMPDAIIIIFIQKFISAKNIYELNKFTNAPIYWQLTDMAPFTGLCHYAWDCHSYEKSCGNCPAIYSYSGNDISYKNLNTKKRYIRKTNLHVIIGSDWLISRAEKSSILQGKKISKVFLSINRNEFQPIKNKYKLLTELEIPKDHFVIGFGAMSLGTKRKGVKLIYEAISILGKSKINKKIYIIYAGDRKVNFDFSFKTKYLGKLERKDLPKLYHCSDLFVSASLQDVGPYTIVEALMCGVPVVSFNTGFANDFIITDKTGYLVNNLTSIELAKGLLHIINKTKTDLIQLQKNAYESVKNLLSIDKQTNSYLTLFREDKVIN